ncbi:MAG: Tim44 domain-containing protein [Clostridia bacterium]|nr:Tim44 domain-containing protein [Clostridia bacterium]
MKKNLLKVLLGFSLLLAIVFAVNMISIADVGNFESYDSGSDWGSSSWDSGWGSSSYGDDYYYSSGDGSYSSGSSGIGMIILIIIIVVIVMSKNKGTTLNQPMNQSAYVPGENESEVEKKVKAVDELFNKEEFIAWSKDLFIKLQEAWMAREWETIRTFETPELFEQHKKQLQGYIDRKQINMLERICVNSASLMSFEQNGDKEILSVRLNSRMIDYIIDENTRAVLKGDKDKNIYSTYKLTFIRKAGVKTKPGMKTVNTTNCPNCGAPTQITSAGKCEYCGSVITTGEFNWVLSNLERI